MSKLAPGMNETRRIISGLLIEEIGRLERLQAQWSMPGRAIELEHVKKALAQTESVERVGPNSFWLPLEDGIYALIPTESVRLADGKLEMLAHPPDRQDNAYVISGPLPKTVALCRAYQYLALDQPDAPGYWAFEGKVVTQLGESEELAWVVEVSLNSIDNDLYAHSTTGHSKPAEWMIGKWTRLYPPWEVK